MLNILQIIPHTAKKSPAGWHTFNCPACVHKGETADKRKRGGVKLESNGGFIYHCFNCNFSTKYVPGESLSKNLKNLLKWLGMSDNEINKINLESIRHKTVESVQAQLIEQVREKAKTFQTFPLPPGARKITPEDTLFVDYLKGRGLEISDYDFRITPDERFRNKKRIIIPYLSGSRVVGWTSRFLDDLKPKYFNEHQQDGYLFGIDFQKRKWKHVLVTEGIFDAISLQGVAVMSNEFTHSQLNTVKRLGRDIIVVPDQDKAGLVLAYEAINNGFGLSVPNWGKNKDDEWITDANEAVQEHGKLGTLLSVISAARHTKAGCTLALNHMIKRLKINVR